MSVQLIVSLIFAIVVFAIKLILSSLSLAAFSHGFITSLNDLKVSKQPRSQPSVLQCNLANPQGPSKNHQDFQQIPH